MRTGQKSEAFTVLELLIVVFVVFVFAVLVCAPTSGRAKQRAVRINCVCNLKQVGLAYRLWSGDNGDRYPMQAFTNETGGPLFVDATNAFRYFQVMSNELSTPKIVVCPADVRTHATNFTTDFSSVRLSYFVGLQADELHPGAWLSGDRNITNGQKPINGMLEVQTNQSIGWTIELHHEVGNVGLADGSIEMMTQSRLRERLAHTGFATNRLLLP